MLVRDHIGSRVTAPVLEDADDGVRVRLPHRLKRDKGDVRTAMLIRLSASRLYALGDRSGVLRAAERRSSRPFRLDTRQRVIVKAMVSRHLGKGLQRGAAIAAHVAYLGRDGAGIDQARAAFFDQDADVVDARGGVSEWSGDRHHFRFIVSPEHGDRIADLQDYVREVMRRVGSDLGEADLQWLATCHFDTDQPHAHVLVRGRRADGRDLVIPRDYMGYGFRARAQEVAQERLGDLTRRDAERRVWRETEAERFTGLDRRLLAACDAEGSVADGVGGTDAWTALTRGRLRTLEHLGLAVREGRRFRLDGALEAKLRTLQIRKDIIRTLNQRRLEVGRDVVQLAEGRVRGEVCRTGFHDELGTRRYVIIKVADGQEGYGRLKVGAPALTMGQRVVLDIGRGGAAEVVQGRGMEL
jgi:type IV secretory pathway VirD2 relaxase